MTNRAIRENAFLNVATNIVVQNSYKVFLAVALLSPGCLTADLERQPTQVFGYGSVDIVLASPDGDHVVTAGSRGAFLWNLGTGQVEKIFEEPGRPVSSADLSKDGTILVTGHEDGELIVWDTTTGQAMTRLPRRASRVWSVALSPDGNKVLTASPDDDGASLFDTQTGTLIRTIDEAQGDVSSVAFAPNGTTVALVDPTRRIQLWDAETGQFIVSLERPLSPFDRVVFSPDGHYVLQAEGPQIWDTNTGILLRKFETPEGWGTGSIGTSASATFSSEGDLVLVGGGGPTGAGVLVWDRQSGELVRAVETDGSSGFAALAPDGGTVCTRGEYQTLLAWDAETGIQLGTLKGHTGSMKAAFSSNGGLVATVTHQIVIRDSHTGVTVHESEVGYGGWSSLRFSADGTSLVGVVSTGSNRDGNPTGGLFVSWDFAKGTPIEVASSGVEHDWNHGSRPPALSSDGSRMLSVDSEEGIVELSESSSGSLLRSFTVPDYPYPDGAIGPIAISPDSQLVLIGASEYAEERYPGRAYLYDANNAELLHNLTDPDDGFVTSLAFSSDSTRALIGNGVDSTQPARVALYSTATGEHILSVLLESPAQEVEFSPEGNRFLTLESLGDLRSRTSIWDAHTGRLLGSFSTMGSGATFSPQGTEMLTAGNEAYLWDIRDFAASPRIVSGSGGSEVHWDLGSLQFSSDLSGEWKTIPASSPFLLSPIGEKGFFRVKVQD